MHTEIIRGNFLAQTVPEWWLNFRRNGGSTKNGTVAQHGRTRCSNNPGIFTELDYLIWNDPAAYAELILDNEVEKYLKKVTRYIPLSSLQ